MKLSDMISGNQVNSLGLISIMVLSYAKQATSDMTCGVNRLVHNIGHTHVYSYGCT